MATGSGKTFTAVNFCYRLIKFAKARRILFLVDRNNLGKQTLNEFQQFVSPTSGYKFTEEYTVQHLKQEHHRPGQQGLHHHDPAALLDAQGRGGLPRGERGRLAVRGREPRSIKEPLPVVYNPKIPIETFDFIVVDECHRTIYNLWRQVLEYFDAFLIGLTATPTAADHRLLQPEPRPGVHPRAGRRRRRQRRLRRVPHRDPDHRGRRQAGQASPASSSPTATAAPRRKRYEELDDDLTYTANQLDRDVVAEDQIRLVVRTFRDRLPEIFPGRTEVPKTLIFAKTDLHAEDIVEIVREEFGKGNDFCQKITSKTTGTKPDELLAAVPQRLQPAHRRHGGHDRHRHRREAAGVPALHAEHPLAVVLRADEGPRLPRRRCRRRCKASRPTPGTRPTSSSSTAVGVCEDEKSTTKPLDRKPSVPLDKLLNIVAAGAADADIVSTLAARLARLDREVDPDQDARHRSRPPAARTSPTLSRRPARQHRPRRRRARRPPRSSSCPPARSRPRSSSTQVEQERMRAALKPFHEPQAARRGPEGQAVAGAGHRRADAATRCSRPGSTPRRMEKAQALVTSFRQFIDDHKDEIEALQVLYSQPYRAGLRYPAGQGAGRSSWPQPPASVRRRSGCGRRSRRSSRPR